MMRRRRRRGQTDLSAAGALDGSKSILTRALAALSLAWPPSPQSVCLLFQNARTGERELTFLDGSNHQSHTHSEIRICAPD